MYLLVFHSYPQYSFRHWVTIACWMHNETHPSLPPPCTFHWWLHISEEGSCSLRCFDILIFIHEMYHILRWILLNICLTCEKSVPFFGDAKFLEQSFLNPSNISYHFISFFMSNDCDFWSRHISYLCWCWCERDLCLCCCCLTMLYSMLSGVSQWCLQMAGRPYHYRPPGV